MLEREGHRVVLDLGYGTLSRLPDPGSVDAVIVTHEHPDHMVDLHGFFRARWFGDRVRLPLRSPRAVVDRLRALEDDGGDAIEQLFEWRPIPAPPQPLGPWRLESTELPHWIPNAGVRLTAPGAVIAYTGDTGTSPALAELGRDADLFIVDATGRPEPDDMDLTPAQAGEAATAAGARRLLLTHFWPGSDRAAAVRAARERFGGEVLAAEEGLRVSP